MYEAYYQLKNRPFSPTVDIESYVGVGTIEEAWQTLARSLERGSGPGLVIGEPGSGKSMLCHLLAAHFENKMRVVLLTNGRLGSPRALFQAILFELGMPYRDLDENELRLSLVDFVNSNEHCPGGLLLVIDEAHTLPLRLLEEVRLVTNLSRDGRPCVQLVLAGNLTLEERLASPRLGSLNQRITARCYLERLNREETSALVAGQLEIAGCHGKAIFQQDALQAVHTATDGIPRLVNQLCDHALIMAMVAKSKQVSAATVQEAWADLQRLPAPWLEPTTKSVHQHGSQEVIEFGALGDEDTQPASIPFRSRPAEDDQHDQRRSAGRIDPAAQLDAIEQQLAAVGNASDDTAIEPKQDIAALNPFAESFDEEEVVIDVYATLEDSHFDLAPRVSSREGREMARMLAGGSAATQLAVANQGEDEFGEDDGAGEVGETSPEEAAESIVPLHIEYAPDPEQSPQDDLMEGELQQRELTLAVAAMLEKEQILAKEDLAILREPDLAVANLPDDACDDEQPAGKTAATEGDDRDLIIVEEHADDEVLPPHIAQGRARRQQYRQLFARLRQS